MSYHVLSIFNPNKHMDMRGTSLLKFYSVEEVLNLANRMYLITQNIREKLSKSVIKISCTCCRIGLLLIYFYAPSSCSRSHHLYMIHFQSAHLKFSVKVPILFQQLKMSKTMFVILIDFSMSVFAFSQ